MKICFKKIIVFVTRATLFWLVFSSPAYAYIDPGSALLLFQGLFAAIGAALTFITKPWQLIAKLFKRKRDNNA